MWTPQCGAIITLSNFSRYGGNIFVDLFVDLCGTLLAYESQSLNYNMETCYRGFVAGGGGGGGGGTK